MSWKPLEGLRARRRTAGSSTRCMCGSPNKGRPPVGCRARDHHRVRAGSAPVGPASTCEQQAFSRLPMASSAGVPPLSRSSRRAAGAGEFAASAPNPSGPAERAARRPCAQQAPGRRPVGQAMGRCGRLRPSGQRGHGRHVSHVGSRADGTVLGGVERSTRGVSPRRGCSDGEREQARDRDAVRVRRSHGDAEAGEHREAGGVGEEAGRSLVDRRAIRRRRRVDAALRCQAVVASRASVRAGSRSAAARTSRRRAATPLGWGDQGPSRARAGAASWVESSSAGPSPRLGRTAGRSAALRGAGRARRAATEELRPGGGGTTRRPGGARRGGVGRPAGLVVGGQRLGGRLVRPGHPLGPPPDDTDAQRYSAARRSATREAGTGRADAPRPGGGGLRRVGVLPLYPFGPFG